MASKTLLRSHDPLPDHCNEPRPCDLLPVSQLDKTVIDDIAIGDPAARNKSMVKRWCVVNSTTVSRLLSKVHA